MTSPDVLLVDTTDRIRTLTFNRPQARNALSAELRTTFYAALRAARRIAAAIVGNNQKAVRALLDSYHRIDAEQTQAGLWIEAESARAWMAGTSGDDIAASRASVFERGRAQVRP